MYVYIYIYIYICANTKTSSTIISKSIGCDTKHPSIFIFALFGGRKPSGNDSFDVYGYVCAVLFTMGAWKCRPVVDTLGH